MVDEPAEGSNARLGRGEQTNTVSVPKESAGAFEWRPHFEFNEPVLLGGSDDPLIFTPLTPSGGA
jgi:hypothetical protein